MRSQFLYSVRPQIKKRRFYVKCPIDNLVNRVAQESPNVDFLTLLEQVLGAHEEETAPCKRAIGVQSEDQNKEVKVDIARAKQRIKELELGLAAWLKSYQNLSAQHCFYSQLRNRNRPNSREEKKKD